MKFIETFDILTVLHLLLKKNQTKEKLHKKMKFSINDFFSKCDQIRMKRMITFTEEIFNGKLHFLCSETCYQC